MTYASRSLLTPDAVSDALFELMASLRPGQQAESVSIPVLTDNGRLLEARLILHAGTDLLSVPMAGVPWVADEDATTTASAAAVEAIRRRITAAAGPVERPAIEDDYHPFTYEERYDWP